ncbi:MAG: helix-turn-helix transcriptional regulator [Lachnospiraceae bacterium]|nr:helix-turn-helix transcriptional regulator [Lachnospiraceae bacterium]
MELGGRLAKIRKEKGYKQKDLADKLNVSQQVISNIERNATTPDIDFLMGAADLYCMSLDELIGRYVVPKEENGVEHMIMGIIEKLDDTGKELSLSLVNQVAQHQGNNNGK